MPDDLHAMPAGSRTSSTPGAGRVVVLVEDLMMSSRALETLASLGLAATAVRSGDALEATLTEETALLVADLGAAALDPFGAIRRAKERGIAVLAFGRHTDVESLAAATRAGADDVVPRSIFASQLPDLVRRLLAKRAAS